MNFFSKLFGKVKEDKPTTTEVVQEPQKEEAIASPVDKGLSQEEINIFIDEIAKGELLPLDVTEIDPLFDDAARLIVASQVGSTSLLQRRMKLGYNRASRLMDQLEAAGVVSENKGSSPREVLIKNETELNRFFGNGKLQFKAWLQRFSEHYAGEIEIRKQEYQKELEQQQRIVEKEQIKNELLEKERRRQLQREAEKELIDEGLIFKQLTGDARELIPPDLMDRVWNRDGGKCVKCGSQKHLEFDHIIPFSKGGATTYRNLQILCKDCNIEKSNKIG